MSVRNGPGEGSWSVFAQKVVEERDELKTLSDAQRSTIEALEARLREAIEHDRQPYPTADAYEKVCAALKDREARLAASEAGAAAMREALEESTADMEALRTEGLCGGDGGGPCDKELDSKIERNNTALANPAGAALLERLRVAEELLAYARSQEPIGGYVRIGAAEHILLHRKSRFADRLLRAAQSLHRAWKKEREQRWGREDAYLVGAPHHMTCSDEGCSISEDCLIYYDGCHCTVETLAFNIGRAEKAEAERDRYAKALARAEVDVADQERRWDERDALRAELEKSEARYRASEEFRRDAENSLACDAGAEMRLREVRDLRAEVERLKEIALSVAELRDREAAVLVQRDDECKMLRAEVERWKGLRKAAEDDAHRQFLEAERLGKAATTLSARVEVLEGALQALLDQQHGPPLLRFEKLWLAAMERARAALTGKEKP